MGKVQELKKEFGRIVEDIWEDASCLDAGDLPHHDSKYYSERLLVACRKVGLVFKKSYSKKEGYKVEEIELGGGCPDYNFSPPS